ncbi:membrane protein implicated in regulation of membrane protease activity [Rhodococcus sp. 27YEA15]|uniref:NfeD family protein n=1 Tax=Rhodococcus sp. 27YEA15 TaxID=3156259 RepID=UPI003C7B64CC
MAALVWLVGALVLAGAEALVGDFFLLMLAGGALATAGVSAVTDFPVWVDAIMFGVFSAALIAGVRPFLLRRFGTPPPLATGIAALEGKHAIVLEEVGEHAGQIKLNGEVWTARPLDSTEVYPPGITVTVMEINGATAVVWREP